MVVVGNDIKQISSMTKDDLEALLLVCVKDLLDSKVKTRATGRLNIRRQIARILTRLNGV